MLAWNFISQFASSNRKSVVDGLIERLTFDATSWFTLMPFRFDFSWEFPFQWLQDCCESSYGASGSFWVLVELRSHPSRLVSDCLAPRQHSNLSSQSPWQSTFAFFNAFFSLPWFFFLTILSCPMNFSWARFLQTHKKPCQDLCYYLTSLFCSPYLVFFFSQFLRFFGHRELLNQSHEGEVIQHSTFLIFSFYLSKIDR